MQCSIDRVEVYNYSYSRTLSTAQKQAVTRLFQMGVERVIVIVNRIVEQQVVAIRPYRTTASMKYGLAAIPSEN